MAGPRSQWLLTTVNAVRERMIERLRKHSLDGETEQEVQMALEELETMWEELAGQNDLLEIERTRYQEFFENSPDAYAVTDDGCNVREANQSLAELLGVARADLLGKPLANWVEENDRAVFLTNVVGAVHGANGKSLRWRARLVSAAGKEIQALLSVRSLPLRHSGVSGLCWLFRTDF